MFAFWKPHEKTNTDVTVIGSTVARNRVPVGLQFVAADNLVWRVR